MSEKKFDRYILPIVPLLDIVAACGWIGLVHLAGARWRQRRKQPEHGNAPPWSARSMQFHAAILAVLVLLHGIHNVVHFPYYLTYYNPLAGGSRTAPDVLPIGWGEGLEQVAGWLNQQPNAKHLRVVSWYGDGPLSYYLQSREAVYPFYGTDHYWFNADYAVLYANQWQRLNPDPAIIDYFFSRKPVHTVTFNNLTLARVYDIRQSQPPDFTDVFRKNDATFGDKIQLAAYRLEEPAAFPGESVEITLFLKSMAAMNQDYKASLSLVAPDGALIWREERQPAGMSTRSWPVHAIWNDIYQIPVPATAEPGLYDIQLAFPELQRPLGQAIQAAPNPDVPYQTAQQGTPYKVTELLVQEAQRRTPDAVWQNVRVTGLTHPPAITTGQTLLVDMAASGQQVDGSLKFSLRLVGPSNNTIAQMDKILRPNLHFELAVPDDIDPGAYALVGIVYRPETLTALPDVNGQAATVLSQVQVQAGAE